MLKIITGVVLLSFWAESYVDAFWPCSLATWAQDGVTVAGGSKDSALHQLFSPEVMFVDGNGDLYLVENTKGRLMKWEKNADKGVVVLDYTDYTSLMNPQGKLWISDFTVDTDGTIFTAAIDRPRFHYDPYQSRVTRWANGSQIGTTIVSGKLNNNGIDFGVEDELMIGIALDTKGYLYVRHSSEWSVVKYLTNGTRDVVVAGGNGIGSKLNQLEYGTLDRKLSDLMASAYV